MFNPLTQNSFTIAFVSNIRNNTYSLVSNSVYFQIFHFERMISFVYTCARCWEWGWGAHILFRGGTHRWQAARPLKDVYLLQMFAEPGTLTHPTPPSNPHLPMEAWLFCIFSEHSLSVSIPSYHGSLSFLIIIDLAINSSPLDALLYNPLASKKMRKQHRYYWIFYNGEKR